MLSMMNWEKNHHITMCRPHDLSCTNRFLSDRYRISLFRPFPTSELYDSDTHD